MTIDATRQIPMDELISVLGIQRANVVARDAVKIFDRAELDSPDPLNATVSDVRVIYEGDGLLSTYLVDEIEAETGVGGSLVAEYRVPRGLLARCLVCAEPNRADPRPWCGPECRNELRRLARASLPGVDDADALDELGRWTVRQRNRDLGWFIPLARDIVEQRWPGE